MKTNVFSRLALLSRPAFLWPQLRMSRVKTTLSTGKGKVKSEAKRATLLTKKVNETSSSNNDCMGHLARGRQVEAVVWQGVENDFAPFFIFRIGNYVNKSC